MKLILLLVSMLATLSAQGASFDCGKAPTLVESAICSNAQLSRLDEDLADAYRDARNRASNSDALKQEQRAWLKNKRNRCTTVVCLTDAYQTRIGELQAISSPVQQQIGVASDSIVPGRCHMDSCWWWTVENAELLQSRGSSRLYRVTTTSTSEDYSPSFVESNGYPDYPSPRGTWSSPETVYLFCSPQLPAYVQSKKEGGYSVTIPFADDGIAWGATEGIANLYNHVCNQGRSGTYHIPPSRLQENIVIRDLFDLFSLAQN
ncbi:lysozyme inhibitor LprI family protein [Thiorhodovibrio frisius]|uniref:Uncharacterized protein conserved in bacteria, putative lipoprotein n=1 Tax=Thiorhodovibrio frisius TaxID=631362 RepID=H8Z7B0_9GAMM|nr:lysozyme inhibitor LprI family protein [Thiorhodovibrio frisius]EIC19826.1 uncharacterized protein conserved in bacteria, putative lipoprotein [Thiorhodovibrio frisius]WPL20554.1 hypothetical protein Thiofri_00653 [Thiorhodovibrio frisius]